LKVFFGHSLHTLSSPLELANFPASHAMQAESLSDPGFSVIYPGSQRVHEEEFKRAYEFIEQFLQI
jgi:hypothetical protein